MKWGLFQRYLGNNVLLKHVENIGDFDLYNPVVPAFEV
jgi:hypothetical protein